MTADRGILAIGADQVGTSSGDGGVGNYSGSSGPRGAGAQRRISMNFDRDAIASTGNGIYERIDTSLLPPLFLAYAQAPKDISA